ncbi:MAG: GNAT family N-acetyltransferase, partial [Chlamydiia bacterium]|nr:GNAT family N-acetyltransferase [Chlamydiia bacterium]
LIRAATVAHSRGGVFCERFQDRIWQLHGHPVLRRVGNASQLNMSIVWQVSQLGMPEVQWKLLSRHAAKADRVARHVLALEYRVFGFHGLPGDEKEKYLTHPDMVCMLAEDQCGSLLGYSYGTRLQFRGHTIFYISGLARDPAAAGMGIGQGLVQRIIDTAKQRWPDINEVMLHCDVENAAALSLYSDRFGFEPIEHIPAFYPKDQWVGELSGAQLMHKSLRDTEVRSPLTSDEIHTVWSEWITEAAKGTVSYSVYYDSFLTRINTIFSKMSQQPES